MSAPTHSTASTPAAVYISCMGTILGWGFLNGNTGTGTVNLQGDANGASPGQSPGTVWKLIKADSTDSNYYIQCQGPGGDSTYLAGNDQSMNVSLVQSKDDGSTLWKLVPVLGQPNQQLQYTIQLVATSNPYLNGDTGDGDVFLSLSAGPDMSGTSWQILKPIKL